jgi:hypothetical protein
MDSIESIDLGTDLQLFKMIGVINGRSPIQITLRAYFNYYSTQKLL